MAHKRKKERLDVLVHERGLAPSREMAKRYILAGEILVDGERRTKAGMKVSVDSQLEIIHKQPYVSRGGYKLARALDTFPVAVEGRICADVGASTGGFTDVLLQRGAQKVYAIDVGYGQLAVKLRDDPRVVNMERTNARHLETLPEPVSLVVIDASFISLTLLLPAVKNWLAPQADIIPLIKPQFEAGRAEVSRGNGVIKDRAVHERVLLETLEEIKGLGYNLHGLVSSEVTGPSGNLEFLAWLTVGKNLPDADIESLVEVVLPPEDASDEPE